MRFWLCLFAALAVSSSARAAPPPVEAFAADPSIAAISLSPSGDRFATIGAQGQMRLLTVRRADGTPEFAADLGNVEVAGLHWGGDDKLIVFTNAIAGGGLAVVARQTFHVGIVIDVPTRSASVIFKGSNSLMNAVFGWFGAYKIDGRWIAFVAGVPNEKVHQRDRAATIYPDLYRLDLDTMAYERVARAGVGRTAWTLAPDGSIAGHSDYDYKGRIQTIYGGADSTRPVMSRPTLDGKLVLDGLGRTADTLLLADRTSGEEVAREIRLAEPNQGEVLYSGVEAERSLRDPTTGLLIGISARGEPGGVRLIAPALQKRVVAAVKAFPGARSSLVDFTSGLDRMVIYTESPTDSGTYWLVDIGKKSARPIGSARPAIKAEDLGPVSLVRYSAADGLALDGVLTLPPRSTGKGLPLIVIPHGGPFQPREDQTFDLLAQAFASRGYAVLQPNFRGTLGYGEAFRKAAEGEVGRKLQTDLSDGVAALARQGVVDPKRVCVIGSGYGAYAAVAGVTLQQGVYRCAVGRQGVYDLPAFDALVRSMTPDDLRQAAYKRSSMGPVDGEDLQAISPARHAEQADAPVMLVYSEESEEGWVAQSRKMERALRLAGKPVEVFVNPDPRSKAAKGQTAEARAQALLAATVAFVEKNNPPN